MVPSRLCLIRLCPRLLRSYPARTGLNVIRSTQGPVRNAGGFPNRISCCFSTSTKPEGTSEKVEEKEFQAETRMILDIVAKSLYSDKEVFVRELISNANDALEKLKYEKLKNNPGSDLGAFEITITTRKNDRILKIKDNGIGMTKEELISNLGTIAKSGTRAFLEELKNKGMSSQSSSLIGQFGVGFYSVFMVADKVEVLTKSHLPDSPGLKWSSEGTGTYRIEEDSSVSEGTELIIYLKPECREFSAEERILEIIKKYSNFVTSPISVDGKVVNTTQPVWTMDPKKVTADQHLEFYRFIGDSYDKPRFVLHFSSDIPLAIKAVLYFPDSKPGLYAFKPSDEMGVSLYSRRVLIQAQAENIIPKWLRFIKGVVDCEDIPLNLSRELLQNSPLLRKIRNVVTNKILRFLHDKLTKDREEYDKFYTDYSFFLKEGIVASEEQVTREEIGKLLRYQSSSTNPDETTSLAEYCSRMSLEQKQIFYISAPSRQLADASPYIESMKRNNTEVLYCYEPYDELVLMHLRQFNNFPLSSVENQMHSEAQKSTSSQILGPDSISQADVDSLSSWIKMELKDNISSVKITDKLGSHPCVITVPEMAAARHFLKTTGRQLDRKMTMTMIKPELCLNPNHVIIKKLVSLIDKEPDFAKLLVNQLYLNSLSNAGLLDDPMLGTKDVNMILEKFLEKY